LFLRARGRASGNPRGLIAQLVWRGLAGGRRRGCEQRAGAVDDEGLGGIERDGQFLRLGVELEVVAADQGHVMARVGEGGGPAMALQRRKMSA